MTYKSENKLPQGTKLVDVTEFVEFLGYVKQGTYRDDKKGDLIDYSHFEERDYLSYSGIQLTIYSSPNREIDVIAETPFARSYYDLEYQNFTIRQLRKRFGGSFATDNGRGRYFQAEGNPPSPQASGCFLAFRRFGHNLMKADQYLGERSFHEKWRQVSKIRWLDEHNPVVLSNNLLLPYLIAILEEYFKSTFIALLKYSNRKESFLKNASAKISPEHLAMISSGGMSVEEAITESLSFENIDQICKHFKSLDQKLDLAAALRKPYHRRKKSLYKSLKELVLKRHEFIHKSKIDTEFTSKDVAKAIDDMEESITRCYRSISSLYGWGFFKDWSRGKNHHRKVIPHGKGSN